MIKLRRRIRRILSNSTVVLSCSRSNLNLSNPSASAENRYFGLTSLAHKMIRACHEGEFIFLRTEKWCMQCNYQLMWSYFKHSLWNTYSDFFLKNASFFVIFTAKEVDIQIQKLIHKYPILLIDQFTILLLKKIATDAPVALCLVQIHSRVLTKRWSMNHKDVFATSVCVCIWWAHEHGHTWPWDKYSRWSHILLSLFLLCILRTVLFLAKKISNTKRKNIHTCNAHVCACLRSCIYSS